MSEEQKTSYVVLLVDDQPIIHEAVRRQLADLPELFLHCCADGGEALSVAEEIKPHVILQDLVMPDIDGLQLVKFYRVNKTTRDVPIVVLSSKEDAEIKAQAFALGANDYLVKLPDSAELRARLRYHAQAYENIKQRTRMLLQLKHNQQALMQANKTLEKEQQELKKLNEIKNRFLSIAAHDLRNPLSAIRCFAEFLTENEVGELNEEQHELVTNIQKTADSMLGLVNDLLDVSVIESGRLSLKLGEYNLPQLVKEVVHLNHIVARRKHIRVLLQSDVDEEMQVFDRDRLRQVVDNLISNAVKYSPLNTTVYVKLHVQNGLMTLSVKDEGPGIPQEEQNKLFQTFGKTSVQPTAGEKSIGLGLALSRRMVNAHGGDITVHSVVGEGSEFTVRLNMKALRKKQ